MTKTLEELQQLFNGEDTYGNKISLNDRCVALYHPSLGRVTGLGKITVDDNGKIICTKEEDESQIFRKDNSWSINKLLLERVDAIIYITKLRKYTISRTRALANGVTRMYNQEEKCYVPLEHWKTAFHDERMDKRILAFGEDWATKLKGQFEMDYFTNLSRFVGSERKRTTIYPAKEDVFKAFKLTRFNDVKVIVIGQDPYFNGVADGLAFSAKDAPRVPASLGIIHKELEAADGKLRVLNNDLSKWAVQGVMLLNTILTVEHDKPRSHAGKGWEYFTNYVISLLNQHPLPCVFILWGKDVKEYKSKIDTRYHLVLEGAHPAAEARGYGGFLGGDYFNKANAFLRENGRPEIKW